MRIQEEGHPRRFPRIHPLISQFSDGSGVSLPSTTDGLFNGPSTSSDALTGSGDAPSIPVTVEEMTIKSARANIQGDFRATSCSNDGILPNMRFEAGDFVSSALPAAPLLT